MRLSSQNNQFIFNFPVDFIEDYLYEEFDKFLVKNFIPYDTSLDYINSTIKEIVVPNISIDTVKQLRKYGKIVSFKESGHIMDKFTKEIDITFRSVDSWGNYFMLLSIFSESYLSTTKRHIPIFSIEILDKDGALTYTILLREVILKSLSEARLSYNSQDVLDQSFTLTFSFNWIDIRWELDYGNESDIRESKSIFDIPINWKPNKLDKIFLNDPYYQYNRKNNQNKNENNFLNDKLIE